METNLVHGEGDLYGEPYRLEPWMVAVVYRLYEYDADTLKRLCRRALIGIAKGNAKTEFAAALAVTETVGPVVPTSTPDGGVVGRRQRSPNVPVGAASYDQARLCFGAAKTMIERGPLAPFFDVFEKELRLKDDPGRIYRIAAEAGTNDGTLPTAFVADELHEWTGRKKRVHLVVGNSLAKRAGGVEINITTAGDPDLSEFLFGLYEYGRKAQAGEVNDPSFLFVWFEADTKWQLNDPDQLRSAIREANPSQWMDPDRIAARYEIDRIPEHEFRRYHLCQWVTFGESWLPPGTWQGLVAPEEVEDGTKVVLGFDGSYNGDSTAIIGCTLDGYLFEVAVWERPETVTEWRVPRGDVDVVIDEAFQKWDVVELVCDPARWTLYMDEWTERYGDDRVVEYPNSRERMVPATAKLYDAAVNSLLTHDGSATLTRHVDNAVIKQLPGGRYVLRKDHPNRKIDAAIAAVMAYDRATWRRDTEVEVQVMMV
jgi:phage terminase large subunit-like protein